MIEVLVEVGNNTTRFGVTVRAESIPPVPHAGSSMVLTVPGFRSKLSLSIKKRFTISSTTSRGVKCSPAVSLESSEKRRTSFS